MLERDLDRPAQRIELQDPLRADDGMGDFYAEPKQQPAQQPIQQAHPQPMQPQFYPEPPQFQQPVVSRSFSEINYEIILSKIDVIDVKIDGLSRRLEMLERFLQTLQQQSSPPENPQYKGYQRRVW